MKFKKKWVGENSMYLYPVLYHLNNPRPSPHTSLLLIPKRFKKPGREGAKNKMASQLLTDVEKRACITLSELFLDIELTDLILDRMALSFQQLNLPIPSLDHILRNDLFSILYPNLMSVAGTWTGFDANWLINQVESQQWLVPVWSRDLVPLLRGW